MLGMAVREKSEAKGLEVIAPTHEELELLDREAVRKYVSRHKPDVIIHAAAVVGGIAENIANPYRMLTLNLRIDSNLTDAAFEAKTASLLYTSSSCIYPKSHDGALSEDQILEGKLEPTNENYALAKIVGLKIVETVAQQIGLNWRGLILSNLYGPNDQFDPGKSHLLSAIINKVSYAKRESSDFVNMWGDGSVRREFTFVKDVASFIVENIENVDQFPKIMNLGYGIDYSIREYYEKVVSLISPGLEIRPDLTKPVGIQDKLLDSSKAKSLGWNPTTTLDDGLQETIAWFKENGRIHEEI